MGSKSFRERMLPRMADSKNKPGVNGNANAKSAKNSNKLSNLFSCLKDVGSDIEAFRSFNDIIDENTRLEKEVEDQAKRLQQFDQQYRQSVHQLEDERSQAIVTRTNLTESFCNQLNVLKKDIEKKNNDLVRLGTEIGQLKTQEDNIRNQAVERQDKARQLVKDFQDMKEMKSKLESNSKKIVEERIAVQASLRICQDENDVLMARLRRVESDLGDGVLTTLSQSDSKSFAGELSILSKKGRKLVARFFDSDNIATYREFATANLRKEFPRLPISAEASKEGLLMRRAAAESLLATALAKHIFRPFYFPLDMDENEGDSLVAAEHIFGLFMENPERQAIYRCQLLKLLGDDEDTKLEVARIAAGHVHSVLDAHVSTGLTDFHEQMLDFFKAATDIWSTRVQHCKDLIFADLSTRDTGDLVERPEYGTRSGAKNPEGASRAVELVLFPQVFMIRRDVQVLIYGGEVLLADQPAVLVARTQVETGKGKAGSPGRQNSHRRMSLGGAQLSAMSKIRAS